MVVTVVQFQMKTNKQSSTPIPSQISNECTQTHPHTWNTYPNDPPLSLTTPNQRHNALSDLMITLFHYLSFVYILLFIRSFLLICLLYDYIFIYYIFANYTVSVPIELLSIDSELAIELTIFCRGKSYNLSFVITIVYRYLNFNKNYNQHIHILYLKLAKLLVCIFVRRELSFAVVF